MKSLHKIHIVTAVFLSAAFLFAGCGTDAAGSMQEGADAAGSMQEGAAAREEIPDKEGMAGKQEPGEIPDKKSTADEHNPVPEETQDNDAAGGQSMEKTQQPAREAERYGEVLAQFRDMVQNDFYASLRDSDDFDSSFGEYIGIEIRHRRQDIYYALYDIDANGTMELVIAARENGISGPWYYDLYGYDGTDVVSFFPEMEFGYRTNFKLYENGVIGVTYSSSAAESGTDFYRIGSDGVTPELTASFASARHLEGEQPVFIYTHNGNEISEEEYNAGIQGHKAVLTEESDWTRIL